MEPLVITWLQEQAATVDTWLQMLVIAFAGAIPFVESYFGSMIGVLAGLPIWLAVPAAVIGNWLCMFGLVTFGAGVQRRMAARSQKEPTKRRERFMRMFDRFGVPGVSLLGQSILPSQITSMLMVGIGASKSRVILWQTISIILWGVLFGVLALLGVNLVAQ
ncbi:hypothetical protein [Sediminivirga luteola]|uniref:Small multi-drug export protein n=1 Tax=Sediminivirga luteola TaxID=1774748 RepID=A0A8J2TVY1_9MICO|nr:hypothetical protein [Sediminivirga luteola]GGA05942.1 hypothetical protein GCM10011333_06060 [Sediminivirga luteola]